MTQPAASIAEAVANVIEPDPWHRMIHELADMLGEAEPVKLAGHVRDLLRRGNAYTAEVTAHNETKNVMAGLVRQRDANGAEAERLTAELGLAQRRLSRAVSILGQHNLTMPEDPKHAPGDWYGCAVCSQKTDGPPLVTRRQACCGRNAYVGPCCQGALDRSADDVNSILVGAGHAAGCRG